MPGVETVSLSIDNTIKDSEQATYPVEFLNSITVSGLPPHKLTLKVGLPIMMLRNLHANAGLCNGTRMTVKKVYTRFIEAIVSIGTFKYLNLIKITKFVNF